MVDSPLKSFGQQQSFWPWGNVITKNNAQFISSGKTKMNLLSGFLCWSVLSNLLDSQRTGQERCWGPCGPCLLRVGSRARSRSWGFGRGPTVQFMPWGWGAAVLLLVIIPGWCIPDLVSVSSLLQATGLALIQHSCPLGSGCWGRAGICPQALPASLGRHGEGRNSCLADGRHLLKGNLKGLW